ncbi:MAG: oligosaccharide flippase family protein [Anaerolineaceae bacterium]
MDSSIYGVFSQVYAVYIVASQFAVVGIHLSVLKHSSEYMNNRDNTQGILQAGIILALLFSMVTATIVFLLKNWIGSIFQSSNISSSIVYIIPGLVFFSLNKVLLSYLNGLARIKEFALFQSGRYIFLLISLFLIIGLNLSASLLPVIFSTSECLLFLLMVFRLPEIFHRFNPSVFSIWIRRHFSFGIKSFFSNVLLDLNTRVDILILGLWYSDEVVGIYSLAIVVIEGLYQIPIALRVNYSPIIVTLISQENWDQLISIMIKGKKLTYIIMVCVGFASLVLYPVALMVYGEGSEYLQSVIPFSILMVALIVSSGYLPFSNVLLQAGLPGTHSFMIMIQVFLNIVLNLVFAYLFGAIGSAIATGISLVSIIPSDKNIFKKIDSSCSLGFDFFEIDDIKTFP